MTSFLHPSSCSNISHCLSMSSRALLAASSGASFLMAKTPNTIGVPVIRIHSAPRSIWTESGYSDAADMARSPISRAPSHRSSIVVMSGPISTVFGSIPRSFRIQRSSLLEVDESDGSAMSLIDSIGLDPNSITEPTIPRLTIPRSGSSINSSLWAA